MVPGLPLDYAPTLLYTYVAYGNGYYTVMDHQWYYAPSYHGPWVVISVAHVPPSILAVPVQYYKVPPGHGKRPGPPPWAHQEEGHGHGHEQKAKHHGHGHHDE